MTLARIAWAINRSHERGQRVRGAALAATGFVAVLVILGSVAVILLIGRENQRVSARAISVAEAGEETKVRVKTLGNSWRGNQYSEIWLEPMVEAAPLPPGIRTMPEPGCWAVSPGLAELIDRHDDLGARFACVEVMEADGVRNPSELLAYRRVPAGTTLERSAVEAVGFGRREGRLTIDVASPEEPDRPPIALAALGLVVVPLSLLWVSSTSVATTARNKRFRLLEVFGVGRSRRRVLAVLEVLLAAAPGMVLGAAVWAVVAPRLDSVPLLGRAVTPGDLVVPPAVGLAAIVVIVLQSAAIAVATMRRSGAAGAVPRPAEPFQELSSWRYVPLLAGLTAVTVSSYFAGRRAPTVALAGLVLLIVGLPFLLPVFVRAVGRPLASVPGVLPLLSGRRLERSPVRMSRPLVGVALAVLIAPVALAWLSIAREVDPAPAGDQRWQSLKVTPGLSAAESEAVRRSVPDATLFSALMAIDAPMRMPVLHLAASCDAMTQLLGSPSCREGVLSDEAARRLAVIFRAPRISLDGADLVEPSTSETYVVAGIGAAAESRVRAALAGLDRPIVATSGADLVARESPLVAWILAGLTLFVVLLFAALAVTLIDQSVSDRGYGKLLASLGLTREQIADLVRLEFVTVYVAVVGPSTLLGLFVGWRWLALSGTRSFPAKGIAAVLAAGLILAIVGAFLARPDDGERANWETTGS